MRLHVKALLLCALGLIGLSTSAQTVTPELQWLAKAGQRPSDLPKLLGWDTNWLIRNGALQKIDSLDGVPKASQLEKGSWRDLPRFQVNQRSTNAPAIVANLSDSQLHTWTYEGEGLVVRTLSTAEPPREIFSIADERLRGLRSAGRIQVHGDPQHGFWVIGMDAAFFIEPGRWVMRSVPGLSPQDMTNAQPRLFQAAALGERGSLWTLENNAQDLVRRDRDGKVLVRVAAPFKPTNPESRLTRYGDGQLAMSKAGVLVISDTTLEIASLDHGGRLLWRYSICPDGLTTSCARESFEKGKLQRFVRAIGDQNGNVFATDGSRVFLISSSAKDELLYGTIPACVPPESREQSAGSSWQPCVGAEHRAVSLGPNRYLIYNRRTAASLIELDTSSPEKPVLKQHPTAAVDLPITVKQAIFEHVQDLRYWSNQDDAWQQSETDEPGNLNLGIPTPHGIVTAQKILAQYLSPPGDAIRTEADQKLSQLFPTDPLNHKILRYSAAKLGPSTVVIKDERVPVTRLALYDAATKKLTQGVRIKGLPDSASCGPDSREFENVFNDDQGQLYLIKGRSGRLYSIGTDLQARFIAQYPQLNSSAKVPCGQELAIGLVTQAIKLPSGNLLLAAGNKLALQQGSGFLDISIPSQALQIIPVDSNRVVIITREGLAAVTLVGTPASRGTN